MGYFDFSYSVGSLPFLYIKIRVLGQVHHLSLLICYLYLFICFRVININSLKFEKGDNIYIITIFLSCTEYTESNKVLSVHMEVLQNFKLNRK